MGERIIDETGIAPATDPAPAAARSPDEAVPDGENGIRLFLESGPFPRGGPSARSGSSP